MRSVPVVLCVSWAVLFAGGPGRTAEPSEPPAWRDLAPPESPAVPPEPVDLPVQTTEGVARLFVREAARGGWESLARAVEGLLGDEGLRQRVQRATGPGPPWRGALPELAVRIQRLPPAACAALRARLAPVREELLAGARLRDLLAAFPRSPEASLAAARLGDRAVERGDLEGASLYWRAGLRADPASEGLRRRLLWARTRSRLDAFGAGRLGRVRGLGAPPALAWWRCAPHRRGAERPVAADGRRVYFDGGGSLWAASLRDGRLRWRRAAADFRLLAAGPRLLAASTARLDALEPASGEQRWSFALDSVARDGLLPRDGFRALAWSECGPLALATVEGIWTLLSFDEAGRLRWRTRLWAQRAHDVVSSPLVARFSVPYASPCRNPEDTEAECPGRAGKIGVHPEREEVRVRVFASGPPRRIVGDGALAILGDAAFLTAEGLVASVGIARGELRWLRARLTGLRVGGRGRARPAIAASATALTTVTASGLLVRLDPLTGRTLALPAVPPVDGDGELPPAYALSFAPLVLGWGDGARDLRAGAAGTPLGRSGGPRDRGCAHAGRLYLPTAGGLEVWPLAGADGAADSLPWPVGAAARPFAFPAGVVLAGRDGVGFLSAAPVALEPRLPARPGVAELGAGHWRIRLAAEIALRRAILSGNGGLREALRAGRTSEDLELASACERLSALAERAARWRRIAPGAPQPLVEAYLSGGGLERLAPLCEHLAAGGEGLAEALAGEILAAETTAEKTALLERLLLVDRRTRGALLARTRTDPRPGVVRAGAQLCVRLARAGREGLLRRLLADEALAALPDGAAVRALATLGTPELWRRLAPTGRGTPDVLQAVRTWCLANPGPPADPDLLLAELRPFLQERSR
ncbi:MAG: hypothetical protein D6731_14700 [Planctomycetota bacterium]|nr:MAG: hypothetical protein D6731_14700 [Planctomycetota bacterium]